MSRLGAYYAAHTLDPISGLGAVSAQASLAHEAIRSMLRGPSGNYTPWATQGASGWTPIQNPEFDYRAFPINASTLAAAEREAVGNPVGLVAAIYPAALGLEQADMLFANSPYEFSHAEAIYRLDDLSDPPRPWFIYWGALADEGTRDVYGSNEALEAAIQQSGGEFVFVLPIERMAQSRPAPTTDAAMALPSASPSAPSAEPSPALAPAEPGPAVASTQPSILALGVVGALGAVVGWSLVKGW